MAAKYSPESSHEEDQQSEEEYDEVAELPFSGAGAAQLDSSDQAEEEHNDSVEVQIIEVPEDPQNEPEYQPAEVIPVSVYPEDIPEPQEVQEVESYNPALRETYSSNEAVHSSKKPLRSKPEHAFTVYVLAPYSLEFIKASMTSETGFLVNPKQRCVEVKEGDLVTVRNKPQGILLKGSCEALTNHPTETTDSPKLRSEKGSTLRKEWDNSLLSFVVNSAPGVKSHAPADFLWGLRVGALPEIDYPNCLVWDDKGRSLGNGYFNPKNGLEIDGWMPILGEVKKCSKKDNPDDEEVFEYWLPWNSKGTKVGKERPRYFLVKMVPSSQSKDNKKELPSPQKSSPLRVWKAKSEIPPSDTRYIPVRKLMLDLRDPNGNELFLDIDEKDHTDHRKKKPLTLRETRDMPFRIETNP